MMRNILEGKEAVVFDLDGTLAKSKQPIDRKMARLLLWLIKKKKVAVIGGGKISLFRRQFFRFFASSRANLGNLYLFPTNGAALYRYKNSWRKVYEVRLTRNEIRRVKKFFYNTLLMAGFTYPERRFGSLIENRGTQVTFSALGQRAPLWLKEKWNRDSDIRPKIMRALKKLLPDFEIREGGLTSIDVTKKGIDKGYAVLNFLKILRLSKNNVVFIGDALFPGGNDYSVKRAGVRCVKVSGPEETGRIIRKSLENQKT